MRIDILTLFPRMIEAPFQESIVKRAIDKNIVEIHIHNIRDYANNKHNVVDDTPYGGGPGMVMKPEPVFSAVDTILQDRKRPVKYRILLMSPQGEFFSHKKAKQLSKCKHLLIICGHYEGIDERVRKYLITDEISVGDFVLTGGEIPALLVVDSVVRLIPGVVGKKESICNETFYNGILGCPQYTRPQDFRSMKVPDILLSGDHARIKKWRKKEALKATLNKRPDLLKSAKLDKDQKKILFDIIKEKEEFRE